MIYYQMYKFVLLHQRRVSNGIKADEQRTAS